jgi:putative FmdB family regulatory protein
MPIYEYRRPDGSTFEVQQSFSEDSLTVDPETGVPVVRVLHAPAVHFKGKGFYNTDYGTRNRNRETAAAAEKSSSEKQGGEKQGGEKQGGEKGTAEKSSSGKSASESSSANSSSSKGEKSSAKQKDAKPLPSKG